MADVGAGRTDRQKKKILKAPVITIGFILKHFFREIVKLYCS